VFFEDLGMRNATLSLIAAQERGILYDVPKTVLCFLTVESFVT
jgi:hypothetical protein